MIDIDNLLRSAMKSGNKTELKAYRNLKAEFQAVKTSKDYKGDWNDKLELHTITKYGRKLEAAICQFGTSNSEVKSEYMEELEIIKKLLPEPVNESQIYSELLNWAKSSGEQGLSTKIIIHKKEMGTVIKYLKFKFPTADGKMISEIVKKYVI